MARAVIRCAVAITAFTATFFLGVPFLGVPALPTSQAASAQVGELSVVRQTAFVAAEGEVALVLNWTGPVTPDLVLSVVFHQPITDPAEVGETASAVLNRTRPVPLSQLPRTEDGLLTATVRLRSSAPVDPERLLLPESGTYPMTIEIRSAEGAVASTRSHLVRLPSETAEIPLLPVAVIVPVAASFTDGLGLDEVQSILESYPEVFFTIQMDDVVLNQLESDPPMAAAFAVAVGDRPVIAKPSFNLDPSALAEIGQPQLFALALDQMTGRLNALNLQPAEGTIALDAELTQQGAELLLDLGYSQILMVGSQADGSPGTVNTPGGSIRLVEPDEELTELLKSSSRSIERAYELLAVLATRYESDPAPVIVGGDRFGSLDRTALDILFEALRQPALLESEDLRSAAQTLPSLPIRAAEQSQQNLQGVANDLVAIDQLAQTAAEFTGEERLSAINLELLSSLSRDRNPEDRQRAVTRVLDDLQATFQVISMPERRAVTLTAVENPLPFTITNSASEPRTVLLEFRSDRVAVLESANASAEVTEQLLLEVPPGTHSIDLTVQAQSLGVSTLQVVAMTPDGRQTLAASEFRLRSTAVPNLGWLLSGLALLFLIVWWARQWKSGSQRRNPPDTSGLGDDAIKAGEIETGDTDPLKPLAPVRAAETGIQ